MRPDNWTVISWLVTFGAHGGEIVAATLVVAGTYLGCDWWSGRRNRRRRQAIEKARDAAAPAWADPDLPVDGEWERLYAVVHQHEHQQQREETHERTGEK